MHHMKSFHAIVIITNPCHAIRSTRPLSSLPSGGGLVPPFGFHSRSGTWLSADLPCCLFPSGVQMDLCSRREGLSSQSSCREWDVTQWELNSGMGLTTSHCKVSV